MAIGWMSSLTRDVADDAVRAGVVAGDALDAFASAGDEGDARAAPMQLADERQAQAGRAAGDRDAQPQER